MTDNQARRDEVAAVLYVLDHGDWISGTPRTPWGTSREQSRRAEYERKADALLASDALARIEREAKAEAWDEALNHVWDLADPAWSVVITQASKYVVVDADIIQAQRENPYRAALDEPTGEA